MRYHSVVQPFARWKRTTYLVVLAALFVCAVPVAIFYAAGYRYRGAFGIVHTGGIFLSVPYTDVRVSLDGAEVGTTGLLKRDFYVSDLLPGAYRMRAERAGDRPWERVLVVEQNLVSTASVFLIPETFTVVRLTTATSTSAGNATSTRTISGAEREAYLAAFQAAPATTSRGAVEERDGAALFVQDGDAVVRWVKTDVPHPSAFCGRPSYCVDEIPIETGAQKTTRAAFFSGGVVYATREGGIVITEVDARPTVVPVALYPKRGADFIISGGVLIVKDGAALYEVQGL